MAILIECPQRKVKEIRVETESRSDPNGSFPVAARVVRVIGDGHETDPFETYRRAARQNIQAPHYAFAGITKEADLLPFFRQHGVPSYEGDRLMVGEVLIQARRLRLVMEAWAASSKEGLRRLIGELRFALRWDAHWYYWPSTIWNVGSGNLQKGWEEQRRLVYAFREGERDREQKHAATLSDKELDTSLHELLYRVCNEPIERIQFTPSFDLLDQNVRAKRRVNLTWLMKPVQHLGERIHEYGDSPIEEPIISAPYGLMYLLDLSEGAESRVCADISCRKVFAAGRADKIFCDYSCAHRSAVRQSRARAKSKHSKRRIRSRRKT